MLIIAVYFNTEMKMSPIYNPVKYTDLHKVN